MCSHTRICTGNTQTSVPAELVNRLHAAYPHDIGLFAPYFLNYFTLSPGHAVFLAPNEPHAYLFGGKIE
jgi:mannose-6-phosphate isomerase